MALFCNPRSRTDTVKRRVTAAPPPHVGKPAAENSGKGVWPQDDLRRHPTEYSAGRLVSADVTRKRRQPRNRAASTSDLHWAGVYV